VKARDWKNRIASRDAECLERVRKRASYEMKSARAGVSWTPAADLLTALWPSERDLVPEAQCSTEALVLLPRRAMQRRKLSAP